MRDTPVTPMLIAPECVAGETPRLRSPNCRRMEG